MHLNNKSFFLYIVIFGFDGFFVSICTQKQVLVIIIGKARYA